MDRPEWNTLSERIESRTSPPRAMSSTVFGVRNRTCITSERNPVIKPSAIGEKVSHAFTFGGGRGGVWRKGSARALETRIDIVCEQGFTEENLGPLYMGCIPRFMGGGLGSRVKG